MSHVRVFDNSAGRVKAPDGSPADAQIVEHRIDADALGAAAYTEENVPPSLKGLPWTVMERAAYEASLPPRAAEPPPPSFEERVRQVVERDFGLVRTA